MFGGLSVRKSWASDNAEPETHTKSLARRIVGLQDNRVVLPLGTPVAMGTSNALCVTDWVCSEMVTTPTGVGAQGLRAKATQESDHTLLGLEMGDVTGQLEGVHHAQG
jgi:hypothetical protein